MVFEGGKRAGKEFFCFVFHLLFFLIFLSVSCNNPSPRINPPAEINNFGGEASFYVRSPEKEGRLRLSFYFEIPEKARLEIFNPFGGLESLLWLNGTQATLCIPKEKVYWQGNTLWITSDFLGGEISTSELIGVFSARWSALSPENGWEIFRNQNGQVSGGKRAALRFKIKETFIETEIPKTLYFETEQFQVRIRLLKMRFNRPWKEELFVPFFPAGVRKLSWEEISQRWKR